MISFVKMSDKILKFNNTEVNKKDFNASKNSLF